MKKSTTVLTVLVLTLTLWAGSAFAYDINDINDDLYVGADDHNYGDVVGLTSQFEIYGADVTLSGSWLSIIIDTNFAGLGDEHLFSGYAGGQTPVGEGIGYGDLFLSDSWTPFGTSPYTLDNYYSPTTTNWTYGFALDDQWGSEGTGPRTGNLYSIGRSDIFLSEHYLSGATYRNGQEVGVNEGSNNITLINNTGTWTIGAGTISFLIDIGDTNLLSSGTGEIALHWGMTCANDVIEGSTTVPEPATMLLFGVGLIGMVGLGRKKIIKR